MRRGVSAPTAAGTAAARLGSAAPPRACTNLTPCMLAASNSLNLMSHVWGNEVSGLGEWAGAPVQRFCALMGQADTPGEPLTRPHSESLLLFPSPNVPRSRHRARHLQRVWQEGQWRRKLGVAALQAGPGKKGMAGPGQAGAEGTALHAGVRRIRQPSSQAPAMASHLAARLLLIAMLLVAMRRT